jgi:hypothetical protein
MTGVGASPVMAYRVDALSQPDQPAGPEPRCDEVIGDSDGGELGAGHPAALPGSDLTDRSVGPRLKNARFLGSEPGFLTFLGHRSTPAGYGAPINPSPSPTTNFRVTKASLGGEPER